MPLPNLPPNERPRYLITLPEDEYLKLSQLDLVNYLSPLFPACRPSNDKKIETAIKTKPKKHIAEQFTLPNIAELLKQNAALKKK